MQQTKGFAIAAATLPKPGQPDSSNADYFSFSLKEPEAPVVLAIVCDGLSSCKNGSRAARLTCQSMIGEFNSNWDSNSDASEWLRLALIKSHYHVCECYPLGDAHCTVVAAIVLSETNQIFVANAGDSPAYLYRNGSLSQMTQNHLTSVVKSSKTGSGHPGISRALTNFVGKNGAFSPELSAFSFLEGEFLCLATDGVPASAVDRYVGSLTWAPSEVGVSRCCDEARQSTDDDATLLVMRLWLSSAAETAHSKLLLYESLDDSARQEILDEIASLVQIDALALRDCFMVETDETRANLLFSSMQADIAALSRSEWIECLEKSLAANHRKVAGQLTMLIRKL